jgi:hypothetical protein
MSYGTAHALQVAIFGALTADATLFGLVGNAIYDELPPGPVEGTYVSLGAEDARDLSAEDAGLAAHSFGVSVVSTAEGFLEAKAVASAVSDALVDASPSMSRGRIVSLRFVRARANRVRAGQVRRIDMTFRAIVEDD